MRGKIALLTLIFMLFAGVASASKPYLLRFGEQLLWTPYQFGAARYFQWDGSYNPAFTGKTFDCSSFTQYAGYKGLGVKLSGDSRSQYKNNGYVIRKEHLRIGDLIFFTTPSRASYPVGSLERVGHVGFFAGYGEIRNGYFTAGAGSKRPVMLHASESAGVRYSYIDTPYWTKYYIASKRVVWW